MFQSQLFDHLQGGRLSCLVLTQTSREVVTALSTKDDPLKMVKQL